MKQETLLQLAESYVNGNIGLTKKAVKRMSKRDFIDFAEIMRGQFGYKLYQLRHLVP